MSKRGVVKACSGPTFSCAKSLSRHACERAETSEGESHQAVAGCDRWRASRRRQWPTAVTAHRPSVRRRLHHFSSGQELVIVPEVRDKLLDAWGIDASVRVGDFSREQNAYWTTIARTCSNTHFSIHSRCQTRRIRRSSWGSRTPPVSAQRLSESNRRPRLSVLAKFQMDDDILDIKLLPAWSPSSVKTELRSALGRAQLLQASIA